MPTVLTRRTFAAALAASPALLPAQNRKRPAVLVRSSWQTVNIGDIAHTPGLLALLEKHLPEARLLLWPAKPLDRGVEPMLRRRFPNLEILATAEAARAAFAQTDLFVHGSAAGLSAIPQIQQWRAAAAKPYGFFGVGFSGHPEGGGASLAPATRDVLDHAAFVFTRETASLANLRHDDVRGPALAFAPDATFSFDLVDEPRALEFLRANKLEEGKFLCAIPRLRYTPYQKFSTVNWTEAETRRRMEVNDRFAESDHAKLREVVTAWVRKTGGKALLCPEMTYELDIIGPLLYDPLPADVKKNVVRRAAYWLPDEASSVYRRAAAVVSFECHSPILSAVQGTPGLYVHEPEDGIKVHMWGDLGLGDWCFEIDETPAERIAQRVLEIHARPEQARAKARAAVAEARRIQAERVRFIREKVLRV